MSWTEYFNNTGVRPFTRQIPSYTEAISTLSKQNPALLPCGQPRTFLLGGFHPTNGTPESFVEFCQKIHSNPEDQYILVDMNPEPFEDLRLTTPYLPVQSRLEELPLPEASVDIIFLDYTMDFMTDDQVRQFATSIGKIIRPDGIVLAALTDSSWMDLASDLLGSGRRSDIGVPVFYRQPETVLDLLKPLKSVFVTSGIPYFLYAFTKETSK